MSTPLYPAFQKRIKDAFEQLVKNQVTPWQLLNSGTPFSLKNYDRNEIYYKGVEFEGSPEQVFWTRYIDPFMEEIVINEIEEAVKIAKEKNISLALLLPEIKTLLCSGVKMTLSSMAKTDQLLRAKGFPEKVHLRSIETNNSQMTRFIEVRIKSELEMWKPKSKLDNFYDNNKAIVWLTGIIVAIVGLYAKFR